MKNLISRREAIAGLSALTAFIINPIGAFASGAVHEVLMLNKDPNDSSKKMIFSPHLLEIQAGDSVKFIPADKGHNSESIKGMIPDGAEKWKGKVNKEVEVTFSIPGFYGYQCKPHANMGMIGLIIVKGDGMLDNLEAAKGAKHRGKAKKAWAKLWEEADAAGLTSN